MLTSLRRQITYANVMATIAVFVALGGSSYAAVKLSRNSVRSSHIKNGQVKAPDVARNAINADKIADGTLKLSDLSGSAVDGLKGAQGPGGPQGQDGPAGDKGDAGPPGTTITRLSGPGGQSGASNVFVPLAFNASFLQQVGEVDQFVGQATVTMPSSPCLFTVRVLLAGEQQLLGSDAAVGGLTLKIPLTARGADAPELPLFEPEAPTTRSFTAEASSTCNTASHRITVDKVEVDVIRYR